MSGTQILRHGRSEEVLAGLRQANIDCVLTDPPYGVDNQSNSAVTKAGKEHARKIANDSSPEEALAVFAKVMNIILPKMKPSSDIYIFTAQEVLKEWLIFCDELFAPSGFERKSVGTWIKAGPGMGDLEGWGRGYEFILYYQRGRKERGIKRRNMVLEFLQNPPAKLIHPHEKPLALLETLIKHSTREGDWIVDPFAGSGSTLRAAQRCNRNALGVEFDKLNYDKALYALEQGDGGGFDFE